MTLHTIHRGNGSHPKVVLLHGGGANSHWWDHIAPALAEHFHVVALDFRGHGDSDHPDAVEPGAFRRDLESLLEHLGAPGAALVGHSMGGHIALDHAADGGQPRAVVAVDVVRGADRRDRRTARLALAVRRTYRSAEEAIFRYRFLPPAPGASEELRRHVASHSVRQEPDGRFAFKFDPRWFALPRATTPPLGRISAPTLVVRGGDSTLLTVAGAASYVDEIPGAQLAEIPGAGHNVHLEKPDEFVRFCLGFLLEHAETGSAPPGG